ncbi:MAG TPA: PAS domain S-box protein [Candidatus Dormibacteraeota bacterium]|nr:PAS domain S-box protein [Candidatus Dormibacteraeota bacterium]
MKFLTGQSYKRFAAPWLLLGGGLLLVLEAGDVVLFGTRAPGPLASDLIQLALATLCIVAAYRASRLSEIFGRYFWALGTATFALFVIAQALATYDNVFHAHHFVSWTVNVLFFFWLTPLGMALFLDLDFAPEGFDWLLILDLVQVILFWLAGYFYFFYLPEQSTSGSQLGHSVWSPYFIYVGFLVVAFLVRALLAESASIRSMFIRIAIFLIATGVADFFYYYGPGKDLSDGQWYDLVWMSTNFLFLAAAATWQAPEPAVSDGSVPARPHRPLLVQALPLLYSLLIVALSARIAQQRLSLAATVVLISFACSGTRLLITQFRQQRTQHLLEAVIEGTSDAVFVKDREGRYLMVNTAAAARVGHKVSEVVGKTCKDFFLPDTVSHILERDRTALELGKSQTYEEQINTTGATLTCLTTQGAFRDAQGKIAGSFGVSRDITDRKRMEENLRVQKAFLEQLIQSAPEAMAITDPDYTVRQINLEFTRVFGYTAEEACGRNLSAMIVPPDKEGESLGLADYTTRPVTSVLETTRRRKDGSRVDVSVLVSPVLVGNELDAVYCIYRDISDVKTTEEQLRQSQKMEAIGRLAGGLAHDLNNLLTVITGYTEMQLAALPATDPNHSHAAQIMQAGQRATALTQQLLAFSRRQVLQPNNLDLNFIVSSLETLLRRLIGEDVEVVFTPGQNLGTVRADPGQLEQVIMNLAINARDAMPKGGRLLLQTSNAELDEGYARLHVGVVPGRYILLTVSDTGVGMAEETIAHIFEPFFTTKGLGKGTGLGLSTVYGIVQQSEGHIFVYSEPGHGSSFKIYLPRVDEPAEQTDSGEPESPKTVGKETILLVEDEPQVRELTHCLLEGCGYSVLAADSMSAVEKHCREFRGAIHLLLTDLIMPGMTGKDVARVVNRLRPGIRVLYMSGYTDDVIDHHGGLGPETFFLQKPFTSAALAEKVRQALA